MNTFEIFLNIIINAVPILVLLVPYLFIRKKQALGKLYLRIFTGILVFFMMYWILPVIFQIGQDPIELKLQVGEEGNILLGIGYIISHFISLLTLFASYPLVTLPFIFFLSPFISMLIVWNRLRKEEGTVKENLKLLNYQDMNSPAKRIRNELIRNDWTREKQIFKLLIALFPISLYLLQIIIKISGSEATIQSSLGWFLEILFVYLAIFIFSIELLFSSQISLKGKFFGETIREQTYKSLYTVGVPISVLSIILFIVDNIINNTLEIIPVILYFFAYFIMASVIFILFLKIFEPFSILNLIKLLNWWKRRKEKKEKIQYRNTSYIFLFGAIAIAVYFLYYLLISGLLISPYLSDIDILKSADFIMPTPDPTLVNSISFEILAILGFVNVLVSTLIVGYLIARCLKYINTVRFGFYIFLPIIILISLFVSGYIDVWISGKTVEYWLTGQISYTRIFGFDFYLLRTASFNAELIGTTNILATPYLYTRYVFNVLLWSLIIYYYKKDFKSKNIPVDEKSMEKVIFSTVSEFPAYNDYLDDQFLYLLSLSETPTSTNIEHERDEIKSLLKTLETERFIKDIKPEDETERKRFYFTLKYLYRNKTIKIWKPEYSYTFEPVEKQGLYIIYEDGRGIFNYAFRSDEIQDPGLVSGMFSAITSFVKEMTKSSEALKKIDHGDISILLEYGDNIFGALFIKGTQSAEVRVPLKEFVKKFEEKYESVLSNWTGALSPFKDEDNDKMVEETFKED
ncbi:MAG: hypothetical protein ACFFEN_00515 [Candidatus Thorarchaeota archaeon]